MSSGIPAAIAALLVAVAPGCSSDDDRPGSGGAAQASAASSSATVGSVGSGASGSSTGSGGANGGAGGEGQAGAGRGGGGGAGGGPGGGGSGGGAAGGGGAGGGASFRIRIVTANTTTGNQQSYDPGEGIRIFQGLDPDIVMIQEFRYGDNSAVALQQFVDTTFGPGFEYYRESTVNVLNAIPNGVISRFPILSAGSWDDPVVDNRSFVWAQIDVPGPLDLWAVSVHFATASESVRNDEALSLVATATPLLPPADLLVVGGDLNTDVRTEACVTTLAQLILTTGPYPEDQLANGNTSTNRNKPYDWLLADADLEPFAVPLVIGQSVYPQGLVFDSRVYNPLAEVAPVQLADSGAVNMQHMAVARDFVLPR